MCRLINESKSMTQSDMLWRECPRRSEVRLNAYTSFNLVYRPIVPETKLVRDVERQAEWERPQRL